MHWRKISPILIIGILLLTACNGASATTAVTATPQFTSTPSYTPTPEPQKTLTLCLGSEPTSLYPYGSSSRTTWSVLEAVYDGPFDVLDTGVQPVILEKTPSLADGDAVLETVDVTEGMQIVDATGEVAVLKKGIQVFPAGCSDASCAVTWDGTSALQMSQMSVTFKLLSGISWSDGEPVTAQDSIYSYNLSNDPDTPVTRGNLLRTASYEALDDLTIRWKGVPGFVPSRYSTYFWMPLPEHAWSSFKAADLLEADVSSKSPLGWGPYVISEWVKNDHITLTKNPLYFRASEGLPKFDTLVYRFLGQPADNNIEALLSGECDLVDDTTLLDQQLELILELQQAGKLKAYTSLGPELDLISFGIKPSSYDDGYYPTQGDRPDFFGDVRMRNAFIQCMDRDAIEQAVLFGLGNVPTGFLPPDSSLLATDLQATAFDPTAGALLLDEVGWKDLDGDPATPRTAVGVAGVADGTLLSIKYATSTAPVRETMAKILADSMNQCGIQVEVQYYEPADLYAAGPSGVAFGRNFDLLEWGYVPSCSTFATWQIPTAANNWIGVNVAGYSNTTYDQKCQAASQVGSADLATQQSLFIELQHMLAQDAPFVPLFFHPHIAVGRTDLCGFKMDSSARSSLWGIENYTIAQGCTE
ncbi:MAG: ABC transporter substrate-binding protein [Anaerolineaceae bacterium]